MTSTFLKSAGEVLTLFLIPIGGGIPAGVILAKSRELDWLTMTVLYFISDIILAIVFEPILHFLVWAAKRSPFLTRVAESYKKSVARTSLATDGLKPGPFALIMIAFGVDPMTGRAAARAAGHGFFSGWTLAIAGDMIFFWLIMGSTLWLNSILGDGTLTAIIILVLMFALPPIFRRVRARFSRNSKKETP